MSAELVQTHTHDLAYTRNKFEHPRRDNRSGSNIKRSISGIGGIVALWNTELSCWSHRFRSQFSLDQHGCNAELSCILEGTAAVLDCGTIVAVA